MNNTEARRWYDRPGWVALALAFLAVLIRWFTFFPAVINHDESTYIVIGHELLQGKTYLVDVLDVKPIGIFLLYAAIDWLVGGSIFGFRLFAALFLAATAFGVYGLGRRATGSSRIGWLGAVFLVFLASIFVYYGVSPNTELFFLLFSTTALWLGWPGAERSRILRYAGVGLLLGIGFMIKFFVAADAFALGLLLLYVGYRDNRLPEMIWRACLPMTLAFFLPFFAVVGYYAQLELLDAFWFYTFEVTRSYPVETAGWQPVLFMGDFLLRFLPFVIFAVLALRRRERDDRFKGFLLLQFVCITVIILIPGKAFGHYQVQLMPPLALLAASYFRAEFWAPRTFRRLRRYGRIALPLLAIALCLTHWAYYRQRDDEAAEVYSYLRQRMAPGETIYTGNFHQILYRLLNSPVPTPYVHSSLLFYEHHLRALDIDLPAAADRILAAKPDWITLRNNGERNELTRRIEAAYQPVDTLAGGKVVVLVPRGKAIFTPQMK